MTPSSCLRTDALTVGHDVSAPAAAADLPLTIEIVADHDGFLALQPDWDALFLRAAAPQQVFQSHVFLRHWARHYRDDFEAFCIVTARRGGRLVMVWPLLRRRRLGLTTLRFMGVPVAQFGDVLVDTYGDEAALMQAGWRAVRALRADILELRKLRADSALARANLFDDAYCLQQEVAPFADLDARVGPDGPSAVYPARERSNHRRRLRRLAERGQVSFAAFGPGPEAVEAARSAIAMKQASLLRHGVVAPTICDPRFAAFFADFAGDATGGSPLRVALMSCAGEPLGIDLSFDCKETCFGHVIATHPDHERGGVGRILVHHSFASALARGNTRFDLLAPADAYKLDHADGETLVEDLVLPLSLKGRLLCALGLQHLRPVVKAAAKHLPGGVARRLALWNRGPKG
jgi:CelD/BcsL family acetyltransferase involved in cellulose biosynthesis